ncbi:MAG: hypothetical protein WBB45_13275 [Cyclobacteriaceae bacterium]
MQYYIAIDKNRSQYYDGTSIFGIKSGSWTTYSEMDLLYFHDKNYSQKFNSIGTSSVNRTTRYEGYLTFTECEKLHLVSEEKKEVAEKRMKAIAKELSLRLYDHDVLIYDGTKNTGQKKMAG